MTLKKIIQQIVVFACGLIICTTVLAGGVESPKRGQVYVGFNVGYAKLQTPDTFTESIGFEYIHTVIPRNFTWIADVGYRYFVVRLLALGLEFDYSDNGRTKLSYETPVLPLYTINISSCDYALLATFNLLMGNTNLNFIIKGGTARVNQQYRVQADTTGQFAETSQHKSKPIVMIGFGYQASRYILMTFFYKHIFADNLSSGNQHMILDGTGSPIGVTGVASVSAYLFGISVTFGVQ